MDIDQWILLYIVFVCVFFILLLIEHYARSNLIGEADYVSLVFIISFTVLLGGVYYFIFTKADEMFWRFYSEKKKEKSRYY